MTEQDGSCPYATAPFDIQWFDRVVLMLPMNDMRNRLIMFWMTLSFHAFLRIGELMALRRRDIEVNEEDGRMEISIRRSKTDQFGLGEKTYVYKTEGAGSPWTYRDVLEVMKDDDLIVGQISDTTLRDWLKRILQNIGVKDVKNYSFHSFRRGWAHLASMRGISDSTIKAHGRWRSEAYLRYVVVDRQWAGQQVAGAMVGGRDAHQ